MADLASMFSRKIDFEALFKSNDISPAVRTHLSKVYCVLSGTVFAAAIGVMIQMRYNLSGILTSLMSIGIMFALAWGDRSDIQKRASLTVGFGLLSGINIGSLVHYALHVDPSIVTLAFFGTTAVFVSFTLAAMFSQRRSYLYLGSILSTAMMWMAFASLFQFFVRTSFIPLLQLYGGLAIFMAYVIFDTQLIIEKASRGDQDYCFHAIELFLDFLNIFIRLLIILLRNQQQKEDDKKRKR